MWAPVLAMRSLLFFFYFLSATTLTMKMLCDVYEYEIGIVNHANLCKRVFESGDFPPWTSVY